MRVLAAWIIRPDVLFWASNTRLLPQSSLQTHTEGALMRGRHRTVKGRATRGADVMLSWPHKPQMVERHQRTRREDLDITVSPCSHVFQCLNHLANERERERDGNRQREREWHTPHLPNANAAGTAAALLKSTWSPKAAFWSLVIFFKSHP